MFCKKCGTKNDDDAVFCVGCGTKISESQNVNASQENLQNEENNSQDTIGNSFFKVETNSEYSDNQNEESNQSENNGTEETNQTSQYFNDENETSAQDSMSDNSFSSDDAMQNNGSNQNIEASQFANSNQYGNPNQFSASNMPNQFNDNSARTKNTNKFSFKRFIFSALVIIATILSCVTFFMNYLNIEIKAKGQGSQERSVMGTEIMKGDLETDDDDDVLADSNDKEGSDALKQLKWCTIGLAVVTVLFAVIELILLVVVRKRGTYFLITLFSLVKLGLSGYIVYLWCFKILDLLKDSLNDMAEIMYAAGFKMTITSGVGIGLILLIIAQLVTFISSIVLMTCKNRKKVKYN